MDLQQVYELLQSHNQLLEQQILATRRLESKLNQVLGCLPRTAPDLVHPLHAFSGFDWASIGARVIEKDSSGAALVSWGGHVYKRRSPANKFEAAIWFSRCTGKDEYERLITFKRVNSTVEPIPEKLSTLLARLN